LAPEDAATLRKQTGEIEFYRQFQVFNYKTGEYHSFHWDVPYSSYLSYRDNAAIHYVPKTEGEKTDLYYAQILATWHDLSNLANGLRVYAGDDDEVYANLVLQVTHQFRYVQNDYTKYPIETFVEGSGDCDSLAAFAAALLKAGGLKSAVIYGRATDYDGEIVGHALIGVNLQEEPNDHPRQTRSFLSDNGVKYYLAEPVWSSGVFVKPWDYNQHGSSVGDMVWKNFSGTIIRAPENS
jgi:hypothetical protein